MTLTIDEMASFCRMKGFLYQSGDIYGGIAGFFDYGHLGVELKNNIKAALWKYFVQSRDDVVGIDGSILTHPKIWEASGHIAEFADILIECSKCKQRLRADQYLEEMLKQELPQGLTEPQIDSLIKKHKLQCPKCKEAFLPAKKFNLMFSTQVGPTGGLTSYLRPETAQLIFANFRLVTEHARLKLPFGIAQIGKAFRNEISPRDFLFRCREFEQFEIEFFVDPTKGECPPFEEIADVEVQVLLAGQTAVQTMTIKQLAAKELSSEWHFYWLAEFHQWFVRHGVKSQNLRLRQHSKEELAHYARACFDIEYHFPFGWKEIHGNADRSTFDLSQHAKVSGKDLSLFDEESKRKVIPAVAAEPSQGIERAFLALLYEAYSYDKERGNVVLKLHPKLAPYAIGVFPLVNKLDEKAREVHALLKPYLTCFYDRSGSIGRRYARADEIGIYASVTVDFDTLNDSTVTIRARDTTAQIRVPIAKLRETLEKFLDATPLEKLGKLQKA